MQTETRTLKVIPSDIFTTQSYLSINDNFGKKFIDGNILTLIIPRSQKIKQPSYSGQIMDNFWRIALLTLLTTQALATPHFKDIIWHSEDYHQLHGDFNGDGKTDSVIIAKSANLPSMLFSDVNGSGEVAEFWLSYAPESAFLLAGDVNNDQKDEILVMQSDLTGHYFATNADGQLVKGPQRLQFSGYNAQRRIDFSHLYTGDFNGDGAPDLLAYADNSHDLVIFHNQAQSNKIKFRFDSQLTLNNVSRLTPFISDFNADGLEDIALLSEQRDGKSWLAFAGKKGTI